MRACTRCPTYQTIALLYIGNGPTKNKNIMKIESCRTVSKWFSHSHLLRKRRRCPNPILHRLQTTIHNSLNAIGMSWMVGRMVLDDGKGYTVGRKEKRKKTERIYRLAFISYTKHVLAITETIRNHRVELYWSNAIHENTKAQNIVFHFHFLFCSFSVSVFVLLNFQCWRCRWLKATQTHRRAAD